MTHSCSQAPLLTVRAPWWIALPKLLIKGGQSSDVCLAAEGMWNYKRWLFLSKYPSMSMNFYLTNSCLMELERNYVINYLEFNKYKKTKTKSSCVESRSIMYHVLKLQTWHYVNITATAPGISYTYYCTWNAVFRMLKHCAEKSRHLKVSDMCRTSIETPPLM